MVRPTGARDGRLASKALSAEVPGVLPGVQEAVQCFPIR